jgi:hypothetical protein
LDSEPFISAGAAVITGTSGLAGSTGGVDGACESVGGAGVSVLAGVCSDVLADPVSPCVDVELDDDDPVPEPLPDEPLPVSEVFTGW